MKQDDFNQHGCLNLVTGLIVLASKDYKKAVKQLQKNPKSRASMATAKECEEFFRGSLYQSLTSVDGEWLIKRLREEALRV
ncbi:MAG: hypothetical protein E7307_01480 [Butyrivibrio sp.]|nr:hypothetical protein [Butyrivibrio sp.]